MILRNRFREFVPIVLIFIGVNALLISGGSWLKRFGADQNILIAGNLLIFIITFFSFLLAERGLQNPNPHAFVRAVYSSMMLKLFICIIAAFLYIAANRDHINKPALFGCMGLYLVYTFSEVSILMKLLRNKPNE